MTESLWHDGICRQDKLGTSAVYGTQESGESSWLGGRDEESQVGADRKMTRWKGSKGVQELEVSLNVCLVISVEPPLRLSPP